MRYYVEQQQQDGRWFSLAGFPDNDEAGAFTYRMHRAGMRGLRIVAVSVWHNGDTP